MMTLPVLHLLPPTRITLILRLILIGCNARFLLLLFLAAIANDEAVRDMLAVME
jgi:hypothetical protein